MIDRAPLTALLAAHPDAVADVFALLATTGAREQELTTKDVVPQLDAAGRPIALDLVHQILHAGLFAERSAAPAAVAPSPSPVDLKMDMHAPATSLRPLDGFTRAARYDDAHRRSIWYRQNLDGSLELRAGREGGDAHVRLVRGEIVTAETIGALANLLRCNAYATEETEDAWILDEVDEHVGPFDLREQNRTLDAEQIDRLCRANMIAGRPWGCAEVDALAFHGVNTHPTTRIVR
jgi:hypothetical protein